MSRDQNLKQDGGKIRMELPPLTAEESIARVMTNAIEVKGYKEGDWEKVELMRWIGAAKRHLLALQRDLTGRAEDTGLLHSEHFLCNAAFINDICLRMAENKPIKGLYIHRTASDTTPAREIMVPKESLAETLEQMRKNDPVVELLWGEQRAAKEESGE